MHRGSDNKLGGTRCMELSRIELFIGIGKGTGCGDEGYGHGRGYCNGTGEDNGYGRGGTGGYADGIGRGNGNGFGNGSGYGNGTGDENGSGDGRGTGSAWRDKGEYVDEICGDGSGKGIDEIHGSKVYKVGEINFIFTAIHGNFARGFALEKNTHIVPCYIAKEGDQFGIGKNLHEAFTFAHEKQYNLSTEEERINTWMQRYPTCNTEVDRDEFLMYHNILTGSCRRGRVEWVKKARWAEGEKRGLADLLTEVENEYGGEMVKKLMEKYAEIEQPQNHSRHPHT